MASEIDAYNMAAFLTSEPISKSQFSGESNTQQWKGVELQSDKQKNGNNLMNMLEESQRMASDMGDYNMAVFRTSEPISKSQFSGESNTQQWKGVELQSDKQKNGNKLTDMLEVSQRMAWGVGDYNLEVFRTSEPMSKSHFSGESNTQQWMGVELQSNKQKNGNKLTDMLEEFQRMAWDVGDHNLEVFRTSEPISESYFSGESNTQQWKGVELQSNKQKNWKKPKDMPKRPLSSYNLFFKSERQRIVSSVANGQEQNGKSLGLGFAGLARNIASRWKILENSDKSVFEEQAKIERIRYFKEISVWKSTRTPTRKTKKSAVESVKAPTKSSSTATRTIGISMCEALLLRGPQQLSKSNALPNLDPIPLLTFQEASRSIVFPDEEATYDFHQICLPSIVEPVLECIFPSTHDDDVSSSSWENSESDLCSESFFPHETVQDAGDDLTIFMDTMEKDCF